MSEAHSHDGHSAEEIQAHIKTYVKVFVTLLVLTGVTVGVAYVHLPIGPAIVVALFIASIKGSLVAAEFMHLKGEKKWILYSLVLTAFMFAVCLLVPVITQSGSSDTGWYTPPSTAGAPAAHGAQH